MLPKLSSAKGGSQEPTSWCVGLISHYYSYSFDEEGLMTIITYPKTITELKPSPARVRPDRSLMIPVWDNENREILRVLQRII